MHATKKFLESKAYKMRLSSIIMTTQAGSGHPTSALSAADLVAALFFYAMRFDPQHPENPNNDRFILSKGHAAPILYAVYKELGILTEQDILTYRNFDSILEGHPTLRFKYTEAATGSLGMGLSIGAGMSYSAKMDKKTFKTYVLIGDSESTEGSIWEAAEIAAFYKLNNLIGVLDCNRLGQSTETIHGHHVERYARKFEAFGWKTFIIDGHDMQQIMGALDKAQEIIDHPIMIIAKTIKGYGVQEAQNKQGFHGKAFSKDQLPSILQELEATFKSAAHYEEKSYQWMPALPINHNGVITCQTIELKPHNYTLGELVATRKAFGTALAAAGHACRQVISLDAEVKNSTYAEIFQEAFPDRFIQCFIAEQNMVSMGVGLQRRGKIPFISTFGAFFSRALDQIRMAAIGNAALRLCGSHAGISIGQDGPSQMALEDIAYMRAIPNSIILYPSDAVSTQKCVELMANYGAGISYLRTTRSETPVLYPSDDSFSIGGCKVVQQSNADKALLIGAGITLHEALKAHTLLQQEGINVSVIDLYSVKPIDAQTILSVAHASGNIVITAEDHYLDGGLGQAVMYALRDTDIYIECLAVTQLPRSGAPEELLAWAGIDAQAMVKAVKKLV